MEERQARLGHVTCGHNTCPLHANVLTHVLVCQRAQTCARICAGGGAGFPRGGGGRRCTAAGEAALPPAARTTGGAGLPLGGGTPRAGGGRGLPRGGGGAGLPRGGGGTTRSAAGAGLPLGCLVADGGGGTARGGGGTGLPRGGGGAGLPRGGGGTPRPATGGAGLPVGTSLAGGFVLAVSLGPALAGGDALPATFLLLLMDDEGARFLDFSCAGEGAGGSACVHACSMNTCACGCMPMHACSCARVGIPRDFVCGRHGLTVHVALQRWFCWSLPASRPSYLHLGT